MAGLLPADYARIRALVQAQAESFRKPAQGLMRSGSIVSYNPISHLAQVRMDGDVNTVPILNVTDSVLSEGMRVRVLYQSPNGADIIGTISSAPSIGCALNGSVSIPNAGGAPSNLTGLSVTIDTHGFYSAAAGTITVPEGLAGVYAGVLTANAGGISPTRLLAQWTTGGVIWRASAGPVGGNQTVLAPGGTGASVTPAVVDTIVSPPINLLLDAGTVLTTQAYQTSGSSASIAFHLHFWLQQSTPEL